MLRALPARTQTALTGRGPRAGRAPHELFYHYLKTPSLPKLLATSGVFYTILPLGVSKKGHHGLCSGTLPLRSSTLQLPEPLLTASTRLPCSQVTTRFRDSSPSQQSRASPHLSALKGWGHPLSFSSDFCLLHLLTLVNSSDSFCLDNLHSPFFSIYDDLSKYPAGNTTLCFQQRYSNILGLNCLIGDRIVSSIGFFRACISFFFNLAAGLPFNP